MVGIEDVPQLEGMWAPLDVRRGLRQIFRRWLPTTSHLRSGFGQVEMFGNDSNLLIVFYVQIMPDDLVMQLHRF